MNALHIHEGMMTSISAKLARAEGRHMDAAFLESTYEGNNKELALGLSMLSDWLLHALAVERGEDVPETARMVLNHVVNAEIHRHEECGELDEGDD